MKYSIKSVLFLGIGGISMHQLAIAFKSMGVKVFGYDLHKSKYTKLCEEKGIEVTNKFNKEFCNVNLCVKTGAVKNSKFINYLQTKNIPILDRAEVLGFLCSKFKNVIAVAGTHGKSTTASLIYQILKADGRKVSCHIGAEIPDSRFKINDEFLVVEACEYNKSFLKLNPTISVITNVEKEHLDCYKNFFNLQNAFLSFLKRAKQRFVYLEDSTKFLKKYKNINFIEKCNLQINPKIKGEYNLKNISVAVAVCKSLGVEDKVIVNAVNNFKGIARRYEFLGKMKSTNIFIDYAHHPTEINSFIKTFKQDYKNSLIIFQPHTYSRTKQFFNDFVNVLQNVENLIIFKEYSARETVKEGLSAKDLFLEVKKNNEEVGYMVNSKGLLKKINNYDAVAFVGAGDINLVAENLLKQKNNV